MSDNGTNFVGAENDLQEIYRHQKTQRFCTQKQIRWKFNPPSGPHHGGVFEIMIKAAKRAMFDVLRRQDLQDEGLLTATVGAEALINSRPLTYISSDPRDPTVLTPNHFLHGSLVGMLAPEAMMKHLHIKKGGVSFKTLCVSSGNGGRKSGCRRKM